MRTESEIKYEIKRLETARDILSTCEPDEVDKDDVNIQIDVYRLLINKLKWVLEC